MSRCRSNAVAVRAVAQWYCFVLPVELEPEISCVLPQCLEVYPRKKLLHPIMFWLCWAFLRLHWHFTFEGWFSLYLFSEVIFYACVNVSSREHKICMDVFFQPILLVSYKGQFDKIFVHHCLHILVCDQQFQYVHILWDIDDCLLSPVYVGGRVGIQRCKFGKNQQKAENYQAYINWCHLV